MKKKNKTERSPGPPKKRRSIFNFLTDWMITFQDSEKFIRFQKFYQDLESPARGRFSRQIQGLFLLTVIIVGTSAILSYFITSRGLHGTLMAFIALLLVTFAKQMYGESMIFAGILLWMASFAAGPALADYYRLKDAHYVTLETPDDIPRHREAGGFIVSRMTVKREFIGKYSEGSYDRKTNKSTYSHWFAAPLVGDGWALKDPVPAWSACTKYTAEECVKYWSEQSSRQAVVERALSGGYVRAAKDAVKKHGLAAGPDPVILKLVDDIEENIEGRLNTALISMAAVWLFFILGTTGMRIYLYISRRKNG